MENDGMIFPGTPSKLQYNENLELVEFALKIVRTRNLDPAHDRPETLFLTEQKKITLQRNSLAVNISALQELCTLDV
jgi:hypothetical protein